MVGTVIQPFGLLCCLSLFTIANDALGPVVVPVVLDETSVLAEGVGSGQPLWVEVTYMDSPAGAAIAFEAAEKIWWLADTPVLLLGATGNPVPSNIINRGTAWIDIWLNGERLTDRPLTIHPRAKRIRLTENEEQVRGALLRGLPGVDGAYLSQVANFLAGNLASLDVTGTSYSVSGFGTVVNSAGEWVGGNLSAMGTVTSNGSLTVDGSNDRITAGSGTLDFDDDHLTTTGNFGIGTSSPSEALTLNGGRILQTIGDPRHEGAVSMAGTFPRSVFVQGNYAYVGVFGGNRFHVVDVRDGTAPLVVGTLADTGITALASPTDVVVVGNYAYVTSSGDDGLEVIDVSDPTQPTHVAVLTDTAETALNGAAALKIVGSYAYIASNSDSGLQIVDISNPQNPVPVGVIFDDGTTALSGAIGVEVCGSLAYVTAPFEGLEILDVSDPRQPKHVGALFDDGSIHLAGCREIKVSGRHAFISATTEDAISVVDVSDPSSPAEVGFLVDNGTTRLASPRGIDLAGSFLFVAGEDDNAVSVLDISDPTAPFEVGAIVDDGTTELSGAYDVVVVGSRAYAVGNTDLGLEVMKLTGIDTPSIDVSSLRVGSVTVDQNSRISGNLSVAKGLDVSGPSSLSDVHMNGSQLVQTPSSPKQASLTSFSGLNPLRVVASGNYAYVTLWDGGVSPGEMHVMEISLPDSPTSLGSLSLGIEPSSIAIQGRYAYLGDTGVFKIVDLENVSSPSVTGSLALGPSLKVAVSGRYAYAVDANMDLNVIDIVNTSQPSSVGNLALSEIMTTLDVLGQYMFLGGPSLRVIDVSSPSAPSEVGSLVSLTSIKDLKASASRVYAVNPSGLNIVDVSDPTNPVLEGTLALFAANSVELSGGFAYVTDSLYVNVIDIRDSSNPIRVGRQQIGSILYSLSVTGRVAVAVDIYAFYVIDLFGIDAATMSAHSIEAGRLCVQNDLQARGTITANGASIGPGGLFSDGNLGLSGTFAIANDVVPTSSPANLVQLYAEDASGSSELKVRDEAGNISTLSPHNFTLIGEPSEPLAWSFYSERDGAAINVDMLKAARLIEQMAGERLVYLQGAVNVDIEPGADLRIRMRTVEAENAILKSQNQELSMEIKKIKDLLSIKE